MVLCESTALALSIALSHLKVPPVTILYDNACNALASAMLRVPWLLLFSYLIVDRFHYKAHTCNAFYNADSFKNLDPVKTSSAESVNAKIKKALYHMRFLRGESLVCYLNIRFALLNLNAKYYELKAKRDVEDVDMNKFYAELVPCNCACTQLDNYVTDLAREEAERELNDITHNNGEINAHDAQGQPEE